MTTTTMSAPVVDASKATGALDLTDVTKSYQTKSVGRPAVDGFSLNVEPGEFITLLGPSGCGKTTTLRMIAGFETPTAGEITVDGQSILRLPPNRRPMSMVFQSYALFPHLSVVRNIGFGLTARHAPKDERAARVRHVMDLMHIAEYADRYPHELSGGQQQRVALARALVMEPSILLFDEPLSNLDAKLRVRMREEIRAVQRRLGITSIFVTHDQSEAMTMSDRVVVMRDGRIEQIGTPEEVYRRPGTAFVATFLGTANFLPVAVVDVAASGGTATVDLSGRRLRVAADPRIRTGDVAQLMVRAESLEVGGAGSESAIKGRVESVAFDGAVTRYEVATEFGRLHGQASGPQSVFAAGAAVSCELRAAETWLMPAEHDGES